MPYKYWCENNVKPLESKLIWFEASHFLRVSQLFLLKSLYLWVKSPFVWLASSHVCGFNSHSQLAQAQPLFWTSSGQIPYFTHCKPFWGSKLIIPWFERINIQLYCLFCCEQKGIPYDFWPQKTAANLASLVVITLRLSSRFAAYPSNWVMNLLISTWKCSVWVNYILATRAYIILYPNFVTEA